MSGLELPQSGDMQRRVLLRVWSDVPIGTDELQASYTDQLNLWAKVDPVHGLAIRAGAQTGEVPTHLFWLRYGPGTRPEDITASHVIEWQNRRYRVLDALDANNAQRFTRVSAKDLGVIRV